MHAATLHLVPILGAEKSRVSFYIAAGLLVLWACVLSLGMGLRIPSFPRNLAGERLVIALSAVLVLATAGTAVITSGSPSKAAASSSPSSTTAPTTAASTAQAPPSTTPSTVPTATTGGPTPPSSPARSAPAAPLQLAANPEGQLSYDTKQLSAKAGKVTIDFANASPVPHDVVIAQGSKPLGQTPIKTGSATLSVNLKPGTYTFYCAAPGHRQAGMEGTLTVS